MKKKNRFNLIRGLSFLFLMIPMSIHARVIYVSSGAIVDGSGTSWEDACPGISAGLLLAASGDELWVKQGTYNEGIVMKESVDLYGGFRGIEDARDQRDWTAHPTIIDATGLNRSVVRGANLATIDGFTITGGTGYSYTGGPTRYGGGIYLNKGSTRIINCVITHNQATYGGGIYGNESTIHMENCEISFNGLSSSGSTKGGGGIYLNKGSIRIINCVITRNRAPLGGGIYCYTQTTLYIENSEISSNDSSGIGFVGSSAQINSCTISDNINGGLGVSGNAVIRNTLITRNRSSGQMGAVTIWSCSPVFDSCIIADNYGHGIWITGCAREYDFDEDYPDTFITVAEPCPEIAPRFINCRISGNQGYGIFCFYTSVVLQNSILSRNQQPGIHYRRAHLLYLNKTSRWYYDREPLILNSILDDSPALQVVWKYFREQYFDEDYILFYQYEETAPPGQGAEIHYSCVSGGWPSGTGNIDEDPMFVDPENGDYRLLPGSPCIDAGTSTNAPAYDILGNPRPVDIPGIGIEGPDAYDIGAYEYQLPLSAAPPHWIIYGSR